MDTFSFKVLVVDDDPSILFLHKIIIKGEGLHPEPISFSNPVEALKFIQSLDSNELRILIFLDINMPRMDGWELLDHLEATINHLDIKVIMVTSSLDRRDRDKCQKYKSVIDYWEKPLDDENLADLSKQLGSWIDLN